MRRSARRIVFPSMAFLFLAGAPGLRAGPATARTVSVRPSTTRTVTVRCDDGMTISDALKDLDPQASNTVHVVGACTDSIRIEDFAHLTIMGARTKRTVSSIESPIGKPVLWIVGSHVRVENLRIHGGDWGVMCRDFSVCRFRGNSIDGAAVRGVELDAADATFEGDVIRDNANMGLTLTASRARVTRVTVSGTRAGPIDEGKGVYLNNASSLTIEALTVRDNQGAGIHANGASSLTNRFWTGPLDVSHNVNGGIWVTGESSAHLSGATVTDNRYAGVIITGNSDAAFWGGGVFTGNENIDVYCDRLLNGIAASPQSATIGVTNCPNTY